MTATEEGAWLIDRFRVDRSQAAREHPPRWRHAHKQAIWEVLNASGGPAEGEMEYSRWGATEAWPRECRRIDVRREPGVFGYEASEPGWVAWHVNFADPEVFGYYGGPLMAQDELQVMEHPCLASLRETLVKRAQVEGKPMPRTVDERGGPTPVLVTGVHRRCRLEVGVDAGAGRPEGLYGAAFARARAEAVRGAVAVLRPAGVSNIVAMAAPAYGRGVYTAGEIRGVLRTCVTAMSAVREETRRAFGAQRIEFVTGWWGCGAFGGNRELMGVLQLAAATWCGIDRVCFSAFDESGVRTFDRARACWERHSGASPDEFISAMEARGFEWGESDGN